MSGVLTRFRDALRQLGLSWPDLAVAVLAAITIGFFLRAAQVWRQRHLFGLDTYSAVQRRKWLRRWAGIASIATAAAGVFWLLTSLSLIPLPTPFAASSAPSPRAAPGVPEETAAWPNVTPFPTGIPIAGLRLIIPRVGVDVPLIEAPIVGREWDISLLRGEAAHLGGTAAVGEHGNIVLAGHITIPGGGWGPFRELEIMQPGDEIFIQDQDGTIRYEVVDLQIVAPEDVYVVFPTEEDRLTLLTCTSWDPEQGVYTQRVAVIAVPIEAPE